MNKENKKVGLNKKVQNEMQTHINAEMQDANNNNRLQPNYTNRISETNVRHVNTVTREFFMLLLKQEKESGCWREREATHSIIGSFMTCCAKSCSPEIPSN